MAWRECTNCGYKMQPFEPRKRRGGHLLCKGCAAAPITTLKSSTAAEEGQPGADLSNDFNLPDHYLGNSRERQAEIAQWHATHTLPKDAPLYEDGEFWPENDDLGGPLSINPLNHALPNSMWGRYAAKRQALGHPAMHGFKKTQGLHKVAHIDHNDNTNYGSHTHHPYHPPVGHDNAEAQATHLAHHHADIDPDHLAEAAGDANALAGLHLAAHEKGDSSHGHPAGSPTHQHHHQGEMVKPDPDLPQWEQELLGHMTTLEPGEGVAPKPKKPWPWKIKDHLKSGHGVGEDAISGSDLFNHGYHDDLHEHDGADHHHHPKPDATPYMAPVPDDSQVTMKSHLQVSHGHSSYDLNYMSHEAMKKAHDDGHSNDHGHSPDHQHEDDTQPPKYGTGDAAASLAHLVDDHGLSVLDHGWQHNVEKHSQIHKNHGELSQPHYHEGDDPVAQTPGPPHLPGGSTYNAMVEHLKESNNHGGGFYSGWESGESLDSLISAHKNWHSNYGPHDHAHEDMNDPLDAGSVKALQDAEQGLPSKPEHSHHDDMSQEELAEHMKLPGHEWTSSTWQNKPHHQLAEQHETDHDANGANQHHTHVAFGESPAEAQAPKAKKPYTGPEWGPNDRGQIAEPEMYAWPHPQVDHPKNKSEVIQHLMDHHPEVNSEDYENSSFKNDGFLKGWHAHLHSGKETHISPSDMHRHGNDDSKGSPRPHDNVFSHLVTHHGMSEDEAKAYRHVDAVSHHEHIHDGGDDEEIGHQHDYPGSPPGEPNPWFVNPEYAGTNHEHLLYHGTSNDYNCPTCGSSAGNRDKDCEDCGKGMAPATGTENQRQRGEWGTYGGSDWNCHIVPHFSTLYQQAKRFGHRVIAAKFKVKKPKYYDNLNHFAHDAYDRLHALGELKDGGQYLGNHQSNTYGACCSGTLLSYAKGRHRNDGKYGMRRVRDSLRKDGYDHIVVRNHADGPNGALNVFPLAPNQVHIHDENYQLQDHNDPRHNDSGNFTPPAGWNDNTLPHEKEKLRPPAYLVDKDPRIGETKHPDDMTSNQFRQHMSQQHNETVQHDTEGLAKHDELHASGQEHNHHHGQPLPKSAEEHPHDSGDPEMGEVGSGGSRGYSGEDDEDEDNDTYCSNCDSDSHGTYDDHCGECNEYTGDGDCSCEYCPACGYSTSHGDDPVGSGAHEYCSYCDNEGVQDGITDHDTKDHEDEHGEHPEAFKDEDYCPHCDTHDKENRDSDDCQNCGATLPEYDQIGGSPKTKGNYPQVGGGTKQWDHSTHMWGHLTHDHGINLGLEAHTPESLAAQHKAAHTNQLKDSHYEHGQGLYTTPHEPGHTHPEFPAVKQWDDHSRDEKVAHLAAHHQGWNGSFTSMSDEQLDAKHEQGHAPHYQNSRTPHQHVEGAEDVPPQEHAPDNIHTHMTLFHGVPPHHVQNFTADQLHMVHSQQHSMDQPYNEWHHEHGQDGIALTGKHQEPPKNAKEQIAAVEHLHDHHSETGSLPNLGYPMSTIEDTHMKAHNSGPLAPHTHPVSEGPHPDEDPWGHLKEQHGWSDQDIQDHKDTYGDTTSIAKSKHQMEHGHGSGIYGTKEGYQEHSHFAMPEEPIKPAPKAFKAPTSPWSAYEDHHTHMVEEHGFTPPSGQSSTFYKNLHHSMHKDPETGEELGLAEGHDHHEHGANGLLHVQKEQSFVNGDAYSLAQHLKDHHPDEYATHTAKGFSSSNSTEGDAFKNAAAAHEHAHEHAPDYVHTHGADPNLPVHPDKPHLNDALVKHLMSHHGHTADEAGSYATHQDMIDKHAEHHGGDFNNSGGLPYNYNDPFAEDAGSHQHSHSTLQMLHGAGIENGKPTKKIAPDKDYKDLASLCTHLNTEHKMPGAPYYSQEMHPKDLLAVHDEHHTHDEEGKDTSNHVHMTPTPKEVDPVDQHEEDAAKKVAIDHMETHHGLVQHDLHGDSLAMMHMVHQHQHYNDPGMSDTKFPIKHDHTLQGVAGVNYPPPVLKGNVHDAHDLAHHLQDDHGHAGAHGYDQATLLSAHAAAHQEELGNASKGLAEHTHGLMYPHGHENAPAPKTTSALHKHMEQDHYESVEGKTAEAVAAAHEVAHMSAQGHKHAPDEMASLHQATSITLPPKAVKPDMDSYELESHLGNHHGQPYHQHAAAGINGDTIEDWHAKEHAAGKFDHVHQQTAHQNAGVQPYPENPAPPVAAGEHADHLASEHGITAKPEEAEALHKVLHLGHETNHQHQPDEVPQVKADADHTHVQMANHLAGAHGFANDHISNLDFAQAKVLHDQSHKDTASLPFHSHLPASNPVKSLAPHDETTTTMTKADHLSKAHGIQPYDSGGNYKSNEAMDAEHDAHHAEHDPKGNLFHVHTPPSQEPHFHSDDLDAAKQHMLEHHGYSESGVEGWSEHDYKGEHTYSHTYNKANLNHKHDPPVIPKHEDMGHEELVQHLNQHHGTPNLSGNEPHDYYKKLHQAGHDWESKAKAEATPHYPPTGDSHHHPDLMKSPMKSTQPGIHEDNVHEHLNSGHYTSPVPGGWEEHIDQHNMLHAANPGNHLNHSHGNDEPAPQPDLKYPPHENNPVIQGHIHDGNVKEHLSQVHNYATSADDTPAALHGHHHDLHIKPLDSNDHHGHYAPTGVTPPTSLPASTPSVPVKAHPVSHEDYKKHLVEVHKVEPGHFKMDTHAEAINYHVGLHQHPDDENDKNHAHEDVDESKSMMHPHALKMDKHLEEHHSMLMGDMDYKAQHAQHAKDHIHGQDSLHHTHTNFDPHNPGVPPKPTTASLVQFFEREMVVD